MTSDISLTNYSYFSPKGYEGAPAGSTTNFDLRGTLEGFINADTTSIPFGRVVVNKSGGQGLPSTASQTVAGVSIALAHYEANSQFSGNPGTPPDYPLTLAKKAIIWMLPETNITKGSAIYFRHTANSTPGANEALGRIRANADTSKADLIAGLKLLSDAVAGQLVRVEIDL
jgi:hypothetical protein